MNLGDRIKIIRKSLPQKATQAEFGARLGATREMITSYERGAVVPSEPMIRLICSTYNISKPWLKDGIGPMVLEPTSDDELVDEIMAGSNEFAKSVMRAFAKVGKEKPELWDLLKQLIDEMQNAGQ